MLPVFFQPRFTIRTLDDLFGFWSKGLNASERYITFAVHSVETGRMDIDDFSRISMTQLLLLDYLSAEIDQLGQIPTVSLDSNDKFSSGNFLLASFRHDSIRDLQTMILGWSEVASVKSIWKIDWFEAFRDRFRLLKTPAQYLRGTVQTSLPQRSEKEIRISVGFDDSWSFASDDIFDRAKTVFDNLIQNAIKYGKRGGSVSILRNGNDLIFFDDGIGMDPKFASHLGQSEPIRENRAKDIGGSGIGWVSIGRILRSLGWTWDIRTAPNQGTTVIIHIKKQDIVERAQILPPGIRGFYEKHPTTADDIIRGMAVFQGAPPLSGYNYVKPSSAFQLGYVDATRSPISTAIAGSYILMPQVIVTPIMPGVPALCQVL